jgi:hypothetical protein
MSLDQYFDENIKHIRNARRKPEGKPYGPFMWSEELWGFENGIFKAMGQLHLPMTIEKYDGNSSENPKTSVFTVFCDNYFSGKPTFTDVGGWKEGHDLCDWESPGHQGTYLLLTTAEHAHILGAIKQHLLEYFCLRNSLFNEPSKHFIGYTSEQADEAKRRILGCFAPTKL